MACTYERRSIDFQDIFYHLSIAALDKLVDCLRAQGSLGAARLSCKGFRDALDGSIRVLDMTVRTSNMILNSEQPPSLKRWPRCSSATLTVGPDASNRHNLAIAAISPFGLMTAEHRQRIVRLTCRMDGPAWEDTRAVCFLATLLTSLRELRLQALNRECDALQLVVMHQALKTMPQLELLTLPSCAALGGIATLSHLQCLEVWEADGAVKAGFGPRTLAGLSQLQSLRKLSFMGCKLQDDRNRRSSSSAALRFLLSNLPPSLESLSLVNCTDSTGRKLSLDVGVTAGRITSVEVATHSAKAIPLPHLADLAKRVLLPCLPSGQQLHVLHVGALSIRGQDISSAESTARTLETLWRRCQRVVVRTVRLACCRDSSVQLLSAWQALASFWHPQRLELVSTIRAAIDGAQGVQERNQGVTFAISRLHPPAPPAAEVLLNAEPQPQHSAALPSAAAALQAALRRMAKASAVTCGGGVGAVTGEPGLLLLRGPLIASLIRKPGALVSWLRSLLPQRCSAGGGGISGGSSVGGRGSGCSTIDIHGVGPVPGDCVRAYQVVPSAAAVMLACDARSCLALSAAATAAATLLQLGGKPAAAAALEALPLAAGWARDAGDNVAVGLALQSKLLCETEKVLQAVWNRRTGEGLLENDVLQWALATRYRLARLLPPAVVLA